MTPGLVLPPLTEPHAEPFLPPLVSIPPLVHRLPLLSFVSTLSLLASCAAPAGSRTLDLVESGPSSPPALAAPAQISTEYEYKSAPTWHVRQPMMQGFLGANLFQHVEVDTDGPTHVDGDRGDLDELPLIGGGAQWKIGGDRIDWGLEGMLSFAWRSDATAFVVGGGGAAVAVDVDLLIFELYGGPFASVFLGDKLRLYGAAGPLLQWANYDQSGALGDDGSGFGTGVYARTGLECAIAASGTVKESALRSRSTQPVKPARARRTSSGTRATLCVPTRTSTYGARSRTPVPSSCATQPPTPMTRSGLAAFSRLSRPRAWNSFSAAFSRTAQVLMKTKSASAAPAARS